MSLCNLHQKRYTYDPARLLYRLWGRSQKLMLTGTG
jgi:hypothetical protein